MRICKVLKASAAEVKPGGVGFFVQAGLVAKLASEFSGEREVTLNLADNIDAVALKGCAAERATILAAVMKPTLAEAIR